MIQNTLLLNNSMYQISTSSWLNIVTEFFSTWKSILTYSKIPAQCRLANKDLNYLDVNLEKIPRTPADGRLLNKPLLLLIKIWMVCWTLSCQLHLLFICYGYKSLQNTSKTAITAISILIPNKNTLLIKICMVTSKIPY